MFSDTLLMITLYSYVANGVSSMSGVTGRIVKPLQNVSRITGTDFTTAFE
jgi:hypothetical protein